MYNVEYYISNCIESILKQDYTDYEIILVDDGSPDNSGMIADDYANIDDRIISLHKPNGGLSDARNFGLKNARGKYIIFLDSDDYLCESSLSQVARILNFRNLEVLFFNIVWNVDDTKIVRHKKGLNEGVVYSGIESLKREYKQGGYFAMAQGGVYLREYIISNNLFFKKGIYHEDEEWMPRVELSASKIEYSSVDVYNYVIRKGTITTHGDNPKNGYDLISTSSELFYLFDKHENTVLRKYALRYNAKLYMKGFSILKRCNEKIVADKSLIIGKWNSPRLFLQGVFLITFPCFYAKHIDLLLFR